ncbi:hypothetical protein D5125_02655 [Magnetovirga frankeli]|uniref:hypothetical protein n=1 Tax=Magnetovirga frankeli TaxID=947516 RepID=UPI0012940CAA|nr:hypothetical protein D5125_02655 [gamma proteobacterium SS-5]
MNGAKFLLDTNFILGLLNNHPAVLECINTKAVRIEASGYSVITRMELLGFPVLDQALAKAMEQDA